MAAPTIDRTITPVVIKYTVGDYLEFEILVEDPVVDFDPEDPEFEPRDLSDHTVSGQIRTSRLPSATLVASFTFDALDDTGVVRVKLTEEESNKLRELDPSDPKSKGGWWDVQLRDAEDKPETIAGGPMKPEGDATRDA